MSISSSKPVQARELKHRVLTCLHKLSDRDTHSAAASELESIARSLPTNALPSFLSSISATDSSDKSPVRRHCIRLVSVLSENHGNSLSPHLLKLLSAVVRRLRDPDSSVRSACVAACLSLSAHLTNPPFTSITKPFVESLFIEQDVNAQIGAALCLAAIIEGSRNIDIGSLKRLMQRLPKLAKCDSFKAKPALLELIGRIVAVNGVVTNCGENAIKNLIMCLMEFLNSDDWASRKAAADALTKVAGLDEGTLVDYKAACLKTFESKKFHRVKAVREAMNLTIEAWKRIPDQSNEVSHPTDQSEPSSKENANDGSSQPISRTALGSSAPPRVKKRSPFDNSLGKTSVSCNSPASTARKRSLASNENKGCPAIFRKLDLKKPLPSWNVEISVPPGLGVSRDTKVEEDDLLDKNGNVSNVREEEKQFEKPELSPVPVDDAADICRNQLECEDLSLIRKQLAQIENQQSHLLDLLQKFMGTSQNGMRSLETRVHNLELAMDEISLDLAVSTGRMSQNYAARPRCWKFPGTELLTSKLWKAEGRSSSSRLPASLTTACRNDRNEDKTKGLEDGRYPIHCARELIPAFSSKHVVGNNSTAI